MSSCRPVMGAGQGGEGGADDAAAEFSFGKLLFFELGHYFATFCCIGALRSQINPILNVARPVGGDPAWCRTDSNTGWNSLQFRSGTRLPRRIQSDRENCNLSAQCFAFGLKADDFRIWCQDAAPDTPFKSESQSGRSLQPISPIGAHSPA